MYTISSTQIALKGGCTVYSKAVSSATTFTFALPSDYSADMGAIYFNVYINMTTAANLTWPSSVAWDNNTAPTFNAVKKYLLSFKSFDAGTTWVGK